MADMTYELKGPAAELAVSKLREQFPNLPPDYFSLCFDRMAVKALVAVAQDILVYDLLTKLRNSLRSTHCICTPS
jgi:hypothetical protein